MLVLFVQVLHYQKNYPADTRDPDTVATTVTCLFDWGEDQVWLRSILQRKTHSSQFVTSSRCSSTLFKRLIETYWNWTYGSVQM